MAKKQCGRCEEWKFQKDFSPNPNSPDGRFAWCKSCKAEYQASLKNTMKEQDPERYALQLHHNKTSSRYGLFPGAYEEILEAQGGVCFGCLREPVPDRRLNIDHEHAPNEKQRQPWERALLVRGLLCHRCNRILGMANDNPDILRRLADYLDHPPAKSILKRHWEKLLVYLEEFELRKPDPLPKPPSKRKPKK